MLNLVLKTRQIKNDNAAFMPTSNTRKAPKLAATSARGCTPCYPRQMETAPGKRRSNLLFTASFQLVEKALKNIRQVAFWGHKLCFATDKWGRISDFIVSLSTTLYRRGASLSWFYSTRIINSSQFIETFKVKTTSILK